MLTHMSRAAPRWFMLQTRLILPVSIALTLLLSRATAEAATAYTFKPLKLNLAGSLYPVITGMSPQGMLIGTYQHEQSQEVLGFRQLRGIATMLPLLEPRASNSQKAIVGNYRAALDEVSSYGAGFLLTASSLLTIAFPDAIYTSARGLNDQGHIVGQTLLTNPERYHAYHRDPDGTYTLIDPPYDSSWGYIANAINNHGDIVGSYGDGGWALADGTYHDLRVPGSDYTRALTINDARQVGGYFCRESLGCSGFLLIGGVYHPVDVPGAFYTEVTGIDAKTGRLTLNAIPAEDPTYQGFTATKAARASRR